MNEARLSSCHSWGSSPPVTVLSPPGWCPTLRGRRVGRGVGYGTILTDLPSYGANWAPNPNPNPLQT